MNEKIKGNILFLCLDENFGDEVSKSIAEDFSMYFASVKQLVEYDLFDSGEILAKCGEEYYLQRERNVVDVICNYENTLMFSNYDIFNYNKERFLSSCTVVYLKLPKKLLSKKEVINRLSFDSKDKELEAVAYITVELKNLNKKLAIKEIYKALGEIKWNL